MAKYWILFYSHYSLLLCWVARNVDAGFGGGVGVGGGGYYYPHHTTEKSKCLNAPSTARRVQIFIDECQEEVKNKLVNEAYQILKEEGALKNSKILDYANDYAAFDWIATPPEHDKINDDLWLSTPTTETTTTEETPYENHQNHYHENPQHYTEYVDLTTASRGAEYEQRKKRTSRLIHSIRRISGDFDAIYHLTLVPYEDKRIAGCLLHCVYAKNNAIDQNGWPTLDGLVDFHSAGVNEHRFFMTTLRSVNSCLRAVTIKYNVDRRKLPEHGQSCDLAFDVFDCISDQLTGYCYDQYN